MTDNTGTSTEREQRKSEARERLEGEVKERLLERRARERERARRERKAERGFFTGQGQDRNRERDDERESAAPKRASRFFGRNRDDDADERQGPRTGAKRNVMLAITQLPKYLRLLVGLIADSRVSKMDRFFVIAAVAYIISPIDLIPDVIPFFGEVDDVFLLMLALQRLVNNAGRPVLLTHWKGDPDDVHSLNFAAIVSAAGFFLPNGVKRRLMKMAGFGGKKRRN